MQILICFSSQGLSRISQSGQILSVVKHGYESSQISEVAWHTVCALKNTSFLFFSKLSLENIWNPLSLCLWNCSQNTEVLDESVSLSSYALRKF